MTASYLSSADATFAIARLSVKRVLRGKAVWFALALGLLPVLGAVVNAVQRNDAKEAWDGLIVSFTLVMSIIAPILVASSMSDEIDDRTAAYLWSRAVPRWSVIAGKIVGLAPIVAAALLLGITVSWIVLGGPGGVPMTFWARTMGAFVAGSVAASALSALIATLAPRFATPLAVGWMLILDTTFAGFDFSLRAITVSYGTRALARGSMDPVAPISLVVLTLLTLAWALRRIKRVE